IEPNALLTIFLAERRIVNYHVCEATNMIIPQNEQLDSCTSSLKYHHLLTCSVDNHYLEASTDDSENLSHQIFRHICD
ncbi:MAG: hypothetical protein WBE61_05460, partial [Nitrososphaeraceae archaeon]